MSLATQLIALTQQSMKRQHDQLTAEIHDIAQKVEADLNTRMEALEQAQARIEAFVTHLRSRAHESDMQLLESLGFAPGTEPDQPRLLRRIRPFIMVNALSARANLLI